MRKFLCAVLSLALAAGLSVTVFAAADMAFPDVDVNAVYAEAVQDLFEDEIILGDTAGNFNPNALVTRQEMATFVCRLLYEVENAEAIQTSSFTDVPDTLWSMGCITRAAQLGIVSGYGGGLFGPADNVTVAQAAKMLVSAWGYADEAEQAGGWPNGYISVAEDLGLLDGITSDSGSNATRAEIAMMIYQTKNNPTAAEQGGYGE